MSKIKNNAKLHGKVAKRVRIEENSVIFELKNDEKITVFVSDWQGNARKSNAKISNIVVKDALGREQSTASIPEGVIRGVMVNEYMSKALLAVKIGHLTCEIAWLGIGSDFINVHFTAE